MERLEKATSISFLFDELIICGAVLSAYELCEALRALGQECYIASKHDNKELEDYFKIKHIREPKGIKITFTPKITGDYAYIRTQDGRWLNHEEPKIAVSQFISDWIGADVIIGNGTHKRFQNKVVGKDIDILIEGNDEDNKNINETIKEAKRRTNGKIVWFGRHTREVEGVETITHPKLEDIPELYNRAKTFLSMSKCEGFNRPVHEAKKCGCNIIHKAGGSKTMKIQTWQDIAKELLNYLDDKLVRQNDRETGYARSAKS